MASSVRRIVGRVYLSSVLRGFNAVHARTLYSSAAIGLDSYVQIREKVAVQFRNVEEKFRVRMKQCLESTTEGMIFTEDLKNMVHLADKNEEDLTLCLDMLKRFNSQNKELRFGTYIFGPVVMRMFHYVERPDLALKVLNDKDFDGFFDQVSSFQVLMDSLYKTGQYEAVLDVFDKLQGRQLNGPRYPRDCVNLVVAACYKLNTKASYDYMLNIFQDAKSVGCMILRKGVALAAALALKQNNPAMALELASLTTQANYITIRNIRLMAMAELDHLDEVFGIVNFMMNQDVPETQEKKLAILPETMEKIRAGVIRSGRKDYEVNLQQVEKALTQSNMERTEDLDDILCSEIPPRRDLNFQRSENQRVLDYGGRFERESGNNSRRSNVGYPPRFPNRMRTGLKDFDD